MNENVKIFALGGMDERRNNPKDMIDFSSAQSKYESLKKDEVALDLMFLHMVVFIMEFVHRKNIAEFM